MNPLPQYFSHGCCLYPQNGPLSADSSSRLNARLGGWLLSGRVAPGNCSPEAPTEPDVQIARIRLFGPRLRYVTVAGRMRGCGSGYRASSRSIPAQDIRARWERRLSHFRHTPMTWCRKFRSALALPVMPK